MYKKIILFGGVILGLLVVGLVLYWQWPNSFTWYDETIKKEYRQLSWQTGSFLPLAGLEKKYEAKEMQAKTCATEEELSKNDYLRIEGGLCPLLVKVFIKDENGQEKNIGGVQELLKVIGKIDAPEKALSLVVLTTSDLKRDNQSLAVTNNNGKEGGFLVEYIAQNSLGCGTHQPLKRIVLVSPNGEMKLVASEQEKPSLEPEVCVD